MKKQNRYEIIFQDEAMVALNKGARLAVSPGRGRTESLLELLAADTVLHGAKPLLVHRLDADTSGVILVALSPESHRALSEQFRKREVTKEYWALVRGTPLHESGSVDLPIGRDPNDKNRMVRGGLDAKKSRTRWVLKERYKGVSLLAVYPVTGRRHQVRVHLKAMGYPLAVDPFYGGESLLLSEFKRHYKVGKFQEERPLMDRLTLHAKSLTFVHPTSGESMTLTAELPKDFRSALAALDKWAR